MSYSDIKDLLYKHHYVKKRICECEQELEETREKLSKHYMVGASFISDMPHGTNLQDKTYQAVESIDKLKKFYMTQTNYIVKELEQLYRKKQLVERIYASVNVTQQFLIEKRYFEKLNWDDVVEQDTLKREKQTINKEHMKMLESIRKIIKETEERELF